MVGFFLTSVILGITISRTNFCTMGAVSDWVNLNDRGRMGAWLLAIASAMVVVSLLEAVSLFELNQQRPPYRSATFAWLRYLVGGLMFGVGMTLAGGCVSRNLVRLGGGNIKSLITLIIAAVFAYFMTKTVFFEIAFYSWMHPLSIDLASIGIPAQDIGSILSAIFPALSKPVVHVLIALAVGVAVIFFVAKTSGIQGNMLNIVAGLMIGGCVTAGWYLTSGPLGLEWAEAAQWADNPPVGVGMQSFTFVNPLGEYISLVLEPGGLSTLLTVGMLAAAGLVIGSLAHSLVSRNFHVSWFASFGDFTANAIGGVLMGVGGVLALGCTIGQGVSGISTLALGSFITLAAIIYSCTATLKYQFYRLVYDDAKVSDVFVTTLVDIRLLPNTKRRLDPI
ncbi:MAG: YeeE/YedE family protein [Acidiferrobacterales bacterium]|nr:YeeE/YedE family protein [Acidiferrobacterales bacterium]